MRIRAAALAALLALALAACRGGPNGKTAASHAPKPSQTATSSAAQQPPEVLPPGNPEKNLREISKAIPIYAGAAYREDLTRRDSVTVRNQYGPNAEVYTMATDNSYPEVYHYYVTYLAQFRAYAPQAPYPPEQQNRTLEVSLNQVMQDPFIPGDTFSQSARQVTLQVSESEVGPHTVIRYIVTPQPVQTAAAQ